MEKNILKWSEPPRDPVCGGGEQGSDVYFVGSSDGGQRSDIPAATKLDVHCDWRGYLDPGDTRTQRAIKRVREMTTPGRRRHAVVVCTFDSAHTLVHLLGLACAPNPLTVQVDEVHRLATCDGERRPAVWLRPATFALLALTGTGVYAVDGDVVVGGDVDVEGDGSLVGGDVVVEGDGVSSAVMLRRR